VILSEATLGRLTSRVDAVRRQRADRPVDVDPWKPWAPFAGPQTRARESLADEVFFGGAAGGGKSGLIVGLSLTEHRRSIIFRKTYAELDEIVDQITRIGGPHVRVSMALGRATTDDGRVIKLGYMQHEKDKEKYRGRPSDLIAIDEAPTFTRSQVQFVTGWARTTIPSQRVRVLLTGNPPTSEEGLWIIEDYAPWLQEGFPDPAEPGELRWYSMLDGELTWFRTGEPFEHVDKLTGRTETIIPRSRTFFPAGLKDNPLFADGRYQATIQGKPEPLRSQMLYGDFRIGLMDDAWQVIPTAWIRAAQARWRPDGRGDQTLTKSGLDVAYGGSDRTVLARRYGEWVASLDVWPGEQTKDGRATRDVVLPLIGTEGKAPVNCDIIGWGSAAYEQLRDVGCKAVPVNFGEGAQGVSDARGVLEFANVRALAYWQMRDALDPEFGSEMALPPDDELRSELAAARYELRGGRIFMCPKDEITAAIGRSPDKADAAVLSVFQGYTPIVRAEVW
jgi:hypothetical protein